MSGQNIIAIICDCDGTLCPDTTELLILRTGGKPSDFWRDVYQAVREGWDAPIAYMTKLLELARSKSVGCITLDILKEVGQSVTFFPRVLDFVERLTPHQFTITIILKMKCSIFAIITLCLLLFLTSCSCPSAIPTPAPSPTPKPTPAPTPGPPPPPSTDSQYAVQLAKKFCPIIHLSGEVETEENFQPDSVQMMVSLSFLRDLENPTFLERPTVPDLLRWSRSEYYLDIADLDPKIHSITDYKVVYEAVRQYYQPTTYARVKEGAEHTILQYWLFYYLNDWRNIHEGDWELVQLHFPGRTAKELSKNEVLPVFAAYSQHQGGQKMAWSDMKDKGLVTGTHPIVYVAQGSHANYFVPGQFWSGLDFDNTGLSSWRVIEPEQLDVVMLLENEAESEGLEWLKFQGYWGKYLGFSISMLGLKFGQRGPFGPQWGGEGIKSEKWENPEGWGLKLPEYPEPFWTSFFKPPGDWSKLSVFSLFSPANLHVYDSRGRHVGLDEQGKLERAIPGAIYITPEGTDYKTILIPDADVKDEYTVVVKGKGLGTADVKVDIPDVEREVRRFLEYSKVPITPTTTARASVKPEIMMLMPRQPVVPPVVPSRTMRDTTTKIEIDSDGDGVFDIESRPGKITKEKLVPISPLSPSPAPPPTPEPRPTPTPPTR